MKQVSLMSCCDRYGGFDDLLRWCFFYGDLTCCHKGVKILGTILSCYVLSDNFIKITKLILKLTNKLKQLLCLKSISSMVLTIVFFHQGYSLKLKHRPKIISFGS